MIVDKKKKKTGQPCPFLGLIFFLLALFIAKSVGALLLLLLLDRMK
jgi:hypothetical protein